MPKASRRLHSATVSRLKALLSLTENFSRATLANAGATSAKWKTIVAGWGVSAGKGTSSAIGALISTTFASADAVIKTKNAKPGVGPAFWVTDSGNWWAVTYNVTNICQTCTACGSYNSCSYCSSYTNGQSASCGCASYTSTTCCNGYGTCTQCSSYGTGSCCQYYGTCYSCIEYTATQCCNSYYTCYVCNSYAASTCCSSYSPYTCCTSSYVFYGYSCCSAYGYSYKAGGVICTSYYFCATYVCQSYGTCYSCSGYTTCYSCTGYSASSCCNSYYTCYVCTASTPYSCCTGYQSCTVCTGYTDVTCCNSYTPCTVCSQYNTCTYCSGYTYGANATCGCASYYSYSCNCADNHKIDLVKKESGAESVVSSTANSTTAISGIKVTTSGNSVTAQAYSDTNFTNQVGSNITGTNTGQKPKEHGIISRGSNNNQGYTIDEVQVN